MARTVRRGAGAQTNGCSACPEPDSSAERSKEENVDEERVCVEACEAVDEEADRCDAYPGRT
uniref:Uncharacterized protein n=1 Tax=Phytophthora fragariae TaxID=53985 RepID=A0A6A3DEE3_9STRA|nr:hypothetical protein PF009_g32427 [Phytophthora fragariae]